MRCDDGPAPAHRRAASRLNGGRRLLVDETGQTLGPAALSMVVLAGFPGLTLAPTHPLRQRHPGSFGAGGNGLPHRFISGESGSSVLELALTLPLLLLLLAGAVDMGRAFYAAVEVTAAANAGAQYGVRNPTNTAGMQQAALLDGADLTGMTTTASWGCECSDGTSSSASCATMPSCKTNAVKYVLVTTALTYVPVFRYPGIPASLALKGSARMRAGE